MAKLLRAAILSVGDELVLGQTVDTNSAWIAQQLIAVGCDILGHATADDDQRRIAELIRWWAERTDLLIVSGGLGPTEDDLTREALADVLGTKLVKQEELLATLRTWFEGRGRIMKPANEKQALLPVGAQTVPNPVGTAPGVAATVGGCRVVVVPGVPREMKRMVTDHVLPFAREKAGGAVVAARTLHTFGHGESDVAALLGELHQRGRNPSVGTTVSDGIVSLRLNCRADGPDKAAALLDEAEAACRARLGPMLYGRDGTTLHEVVVGLLRETGQIVTTAESCTGGLISTLLTDVPGSSHVFRQGFVTYANDAKQRLANVPVHLLEKHGAVSREVVTTMTEGVRGDANWSLAVSGVAGPDGGTPEKPVGTVWVAVAGPDGIDARRYHFPGNRPMVRDRTAKTALQMLRYRLLGETFESPLFTAQGGSDATGG
jgi:nicotinamide-nucleotide amidase